MSAHPETFKGVHHDLFPWESCFGHRAHPICDAHRPHHGRKKLTVEVYGFKGTVLRLGLCALCDVTPSLGTSVCVQVNDRAELNVATTALTALDALEALLVHALYGKGYEEDELDDGELVVHGCGFSNLHSVLTFGKFFLS